MEHADNSNSRTTLAFALGSGFGFGVAIGLLLGAGVKSFDGVKGIGSLAELIAGIAALVAVGVTLYIALAQRNWQEEQRSRRGRIVAKIIAKELYGVARVLTYLTDYAARAEAAERFVSPRALAELVRTLEVPMLRSERERFDDLPADLAQLTAAVLTEADNSVRAMTYDPSFLPSAAIFRQVTEKVGAHLIPLASAVWQMLESDPLPFVEYAKRRAEFNDYEMLTMEEAQAIWEQECAERTRQGQPSSA
jgi:hypothetical protein